MAHDEKSVMASPLDVENPGDLPITRANESQFAMIGRFLWHFSKIEDALDRGIQRMFELHEAPSRVIVANIDYSRKISILRSAIIEQSGSNKRKELKDLINPLKLAMEANNDRIIVAHCSFTPVLSGIKFTRVVAKDGLSIVEIEWSFDQFSEKFARMDRIALELENMVQGISPLRSTSYMSPGKKMFMIESGMYF